MNLLKGHATAEGTAAYRARFLEKTADGYFRLKEGLWFSSLGIGSYLGDADEATDLGYQKSLEEALLSGLNVVDTAIN